MISLYSQQQFINCLILQEIFSASNSHINKKDLRPVGPNSYKTAIGKYTSKAYGFDGNVGYQFSIMDGINLMPNICIRYNTDKDNAYTETGTGVNNMYVAGKSGNLTTGIADIKLTDPTRLSNDTQIVPGLHASIVNSFSNKQPKVKARFIWADSYCEHTTSSSTQKVGYKCRCKFTDGS
ncbi:Cell surface antigen-like protein Sca10 [Rickettsia akari str. Hartford]|uniref:Cell surface antigen-like protein Sca10 n=1 Tax=Rickettsia akari (strain Hartford) TaxID=293614 RepID=A8GLT5_RICAH|nr:autotransporter outer membrane beta-barrel domain-containing protein [Rickettsia akari]ABV74360.1 Cell surface antigen-like protein Sca10 [Rickettsia akari str. Hartford]